MNKCYRIIIHVNKVKSCVSSMRKGKDAEGNVNECRNVIGAILHTNVRTYADMCKEREDRTADIL